MSLLDQGITRTEIRPVVLSGIKAVLGELEKTLPTIQLGGGLHLAFQPQEDGSWVVQGVVEHPQAVTAAPVIAAVVDGDGGS